MKVLFFSHYPTDNGLEGGNKVLLNTALGLPTDKYEKLFISPGRGVLSEYLMKAGIEERIFDYDCGRFNDMIYRAENKEDFASICAALEKAACESELFRFIQQWKPDIVYANTVMAVNAAVMGKMAGAGVLWHIHDIVTNSLSLQDQINIDKVINRYADKVILVSEAARTALPVSGGSSKAELVYIGVKEQHYDRNTLARRKSTVRSLLNIKETQPAAAFLGQIIPIKGVEHFIMAAYYITRLLPDAVFLIIGEPRRDPAYTAKLKNLIARLDLGRHVRFTGYCRDVGSVLPAIDCLAVPSRYEDPLPAVLIEAAFARTPVAAYRRGGIAEAVVHGRSGFLVGPDNIKHLAAAMHKIMTDRKARRLMGEYAYLNAVNKFGYERYINRIDHILTEMPKESSIEFMIGEAGQ